MAGHDWAAYYAAVSGAPPHPTLLRALDAFGAGGRAPSFAVDLGCGEGRDAAELLRRGWRVLAVDAQPQALASVRERFGDAANLELRLSSFQDFGFPPADLVNASISLPFCPPGDFPLVWARLVASLDVGGRFAGHFFGVRDGWARNPAMTFQDAGEVAKLLQAFEVEFLEEREWDGRTALGDPKYWHAFSVVARKKGA